MGAKYKGYCSDLTRTIFIGDPDEKFKKIYTTVLKAQLISMETAKPDMTGEEIVDLVPDMAWDILDKAGMDRATVNRICYGEDCDE